MGHLRPPQEDIDTALKIESEVSDENMKLYLECLNNKPMSERSEDRELRDGCILTHHIYMHTIKQREEEVWGTPIEGGGKRFIK